MTGDEAIEPACTPVWIEYLVVAGGCAVAGFGGAGLLLADTGHFSAPFALALGAVLTVAGILVGRPRRVSRPGPRRRTTPPALPMGVIAGVMLDQAATFCRAHLETGSTPRPWANRRVPLVPSADARRDAVRRIRSGA